MNPEATLALLAAITVGALHSGSALAQKMEHQIDRPGLDYRSFQIPQDHPMRMAPKCAAACASEPQCSSWTLVTAGAYQPGAPRCWLKTGAPAPRRADCCISGVKPGRDVAYEPVENLPPPISEAERDKILSAGPHLPAGSDIGCNQKTDCDKNHRMETFDGK